MKNIGLRLFSLLIAGLLCYWVNSEGNASEVEIVVPIELRGLPDNAMVVDQSQRQAHVSIKGPSSLVARIASSPPVFKIKINPTNEKHYNLILQAQDLSLPSYVKVLRIDPSEIQLRLDQRAQKVVPVIVPRIGALEESLQIEQLKVDPDKITVSGPEGVLKEISQVETYPLDLRGLRADLKRKFNLRSPAPLTDLDPEQVDVFAKISSLQLRQRFSNLPIELRSQVGESATLLPAAVEIELSGPVSVIKNLKREDVIPYVRIHSASTEKEAEVLIELPAEISVVKIDPPKVGIMHGQVGSGNQVKSFKRK